MELFACSFELKSTSNAESSGQKFFAWIFKNIVSKNNFSDNNVLRNKYMHLCHWVINSVRNYKINIFKVKASDSQSNNDSD